jgi:1-acyl-sn-glycerol-3-phosphate acyltransferase
MPSIMFQAAYWATSLFFALTSVPLLLVPSRKPTVAWIRLYTQAMTFWMRTIAGVRIVVRGRERLPAGPCIIAAKHQSWGDGIVMFSELSDLAFVTGDHLEKFPLLGGILRKMGAIIVDNCGGAYARARLVDVELKAAQAENRRILIYPEGHLAPVGERYRYRRGVYHMYAAYGCPAVPVATNLGLYWPQQSWRLTPGEAVIEFLDPIPPGLEKEDFMARLEDVIERRSLDLLGGKAP